MSKQSFDISVIWYFCLYAERYVKFMQITKSQMTANSLLYVPLPGEMCLLASSQALSRIVICRLIV